MEFSGGFINRRRTPEAQPSDATPFVEFRYDCSTRNSASLSPVPPCPNVNNIQGFSGTGSLDNTQNNLYVFQEYPHDHNANNFMDPYSLPEEPQPLLSQNLPSAQPNNAMYQPTLWQCHQVQFIRPVHYEYSSQDQGSTLNTPAPWQENLIDGAFLPHEDTGESHFVNAGIPPKGRCVNCLHLRRKCEREPGMCCTACQPFNTQKPIQQSAILYDDRAAFETLQSPSLGKNPILQLGQGRLRFCILTNTSILSPDTERGIPYKIPFLGGFNHENPDLQSGVDDFVLQNYGRKIRNDFNHALHPFIYKACMVDSYVLFLFNPHTITATVDEEFLSQFRRLILCRISDLIAELMPVARQPNYGDEEYYITVALYLALVYDKIKRGHRKPVDLPIFCGDEKNIKRIRSGLSSISKELKHRIFSLCGRSPEWLKSMPWPRDWYKLPSVDIPWEVDISHASYEEPDRNFVGPEKELSSDFFSNESSHYPRTQDDYLSPNQAYNISSPSRHWESNLHSRAAGRYNEFSRRSSSAFHEHDDYPPSLLSPSELDYQTGLDSTDERHYSDLGSDSDIRGVNN